MKRTDVHSPSNLVTEDYEYAYAYDAHPEEGDRQTAMLLLNALIAEGWRFGQVHGGDTCDHCGARLRYVAVLKHKPTHTLIKVGEQCLDNRFSLASKDFHSLRKAASLNRERIAKREKREKWLRNADNKAAFDYADEQTDNGNMGWDDFYFKFVAYVNRHGEASEKWVAAILRSKTRDEERAAKRAEEQATAKPVETGKQIITGEVLSTKWQDSPYGGALKMLVRDDRGFKVWGSVPRSLTCLPAQDENGNDLDYGSRNVGKGERVTFTATVEASNDDPAFGFFSRPSKAAIAA